MISTAVVLGCMLDEINSMAANSKHVFVQSSINRWGFKQELSQYFLYNTIINN